jgi:hypothetical protein
MIDAAPAAAAWWLERRRSEEYGRHEKLELTVRQQAERIAQEQGIDVEDLIAEAEAIARGE